MTSKKSSERPAKPRPDFPLTAHSSGQWRKRYRGKDYYLGRWDDPDEALAEWRRIEANLLLGQNPDVQGGFTVEDACDTFTGAKITAVDIGELTPKTLRQYQRSCNHLLGFFDANRQVCTLGPADFDAYRRSFPKSWGTVAITAQINDVRSIFKFAYESDYIDRPVKFGTNFSKPSAMRRKADKRGRHSQEFTAAEVRQLLAKADEPDEKGHRIFTQHKAMILLGLNAGYANSDCSRLKLTDIQGSWLRVPRGKTGADRAAWLWPETREALKEVAAFHATSSIKVKPQFADRVFYTVNGLEWVSETTHKDSVSTEFRKLKMAAQCHRKGVGFRSFRHMFETLAGESKDQVAVDYVMGHERANDMAAVYRESVSDKRIKAVCKRVREWYLTEVVKPANKKQRKRGASSKGGAKL